MAFPAAAARGETLVICTAQGLRTILVDDGKGAPVEPGHDCPACLAGHCAAAQSVDFATVGHVHVDLARLAGRALPPAPDDLRSLTLRGGLASRGPPAALLSYA